MSRQYRDGLAYGDFPERWDRARFERFGGGGGGGGGGRQFEEDYRYTERDRPGRQEVMVSDRIESRGPRGTYEERDRYVEEERYGPGRRRRRTDRELFGDVDPREFANMALAPYEPPPQPRPEMLRRRSSFGDSFERSRPAIPRGYEVEERRVFRPVGYEETYRREVDFDESRGREYYQPQQYRDVEIRREKSTVRGGRSHKAKSVTTRQSSSSSSSISEEASIHESRRGGRTSVHESFHEHESRHGGRESVSESISEAVRKFKKGKTRMPKRLVRREAIMDLGYPFDEEEAFFVLRIALEKDQIDEVIRISESYKSGERSSSFKFEESVKEEVPRIIEPEGQREEVVRTEWINPPFVVGNHRRSRSHGGHRHRHPPPVPAVPVYESERKTVIEESETTLSPTRSHGSYGGALIVREREHRSDRDIRDEIARLEAERRAVRLERETEDRRDLALRRHRSGGEVDLVEYEGARPAREVLDLYERDTSPVRTIIARPEKDRKERERARILRLAAATLT